MARQHVGEGTFPLVVRMAARRGDDMGHHEGGTMNRTGG
jgi:hypothetical protein